MWYDLLIFAILIYAIIRGAMKGLVWQLAAIAAIVLCFFFAESASLLLAPYIGLNPPLDRWVAMLFLYFIFSFASFALARGLKEGLEKAKFDDFDRHLGALFGLVKGVVFSIVLTFFVVTIYDESRTFIMGTHSGYYAAIIMDRMHPVMPEGLSEMLEPYIHKLDSDNIDLQHAHDGHEHTGESGGFKGIDFGSIFSGGSSGSDSGSGDAFDSPFQSPSTNINNNQADPLLIFVRNLPANLVSDQLKSQMITAVEHTAPEDRTELLSHLSSGVPSLMEKVAREWSNGKPQDQTINSSRLEQMLNGIASMYGETELSQRAVRDEIDTALYGLPEPVAQAAVQDWHADLMGFQGDPDPQTTINTPLNERILRQLQRAGIGLNQLSSKLQNQLRATANR
ncbi:Colicin V production protein [Polystyrenella longa]|uniref:Colicin V production protein n=1 Tax=Polystyrenella longa TaxID=2528007 RepID=A0A518CKJ7_9PLAN|nr:CvpA family protein [Polystyrenella longa]QDU79742.1 Colicin V production protein [Polystyrenella longa]